MTRERTRDYVLEAPTKDRPVVELWSSRRLPFEPKGWLHEMREALRAALRSLPAERDRVLDGVYGSSDTSFFDVENILFYNVGSGALGHLARHGLRFRRDRRRLPPAPEPRVAAHYQRYSLAGASSSFDAHERLGTFRFELPSLAADTKPHAIWWAMRQGDVVIEHPGVFGRTFGLRVELALPSSRRVNLAAVMKPLFDGIIAGFHSHAARTDDTAVARLARALGSDKRRVEDELVSDRWALLGGCELVAAYRDFVKWNPADHRCEQGELVRVDGRPDVTRVAGEVFALPDA